MHEQYDIDLTLTGVDNIAYLAPRVGLTSSALYTYQKRPLPLALAGALALECPLLWEALNRTPRPAVRRRHRRWRCTPQVEALDSTWRARLAGAEFPLANGGLFRIAAPQPEAILDQATPWDIRETPSEETTDANEAAIRVLEALVIRVMRERDQARDQTAQIPILETELTRVREDLRLAEQRAKEAETMFEEACQQLSRTERPVSQTDIERAAPRLRGLADAVASLPKQ